MLEVQSEDGKAGIAIRIYYREFVGYGAYDYDSGRSDEIYEEKSKTDWLIRPQYDAISLLNHHAIDATVDYYCVQQAGQFGLLYLVVIFPKSGQPPYRVTINEIVRWSSQTFEVADLCRSFKLLTVGGKIGIISGTSVLIEPAFDRVVAIHASYDECSVIVGRRGNRYQAFKVAKDSGHNRHLAKLKWFESSWDKVAKKIASSGLAGEAKLAKLHAVLESPASSRRNVL